jgi:hypothetical protein
LLLLFSERLIQEGREKGLACDSAWPKSAVKEWGGVWIRLLQRITAGVQVVGRRGVNCIFFNTRVEVQKKTVAVESDKPRSLAGFVVCR